MDISYNCENQKFNYRVCAMIIVENKILAMHDERSPYFYLPGGRVKMGETAEQAVVREVQEELEATYYGCYFLEFADYYCQENNDEREMLKLLYQSLRALTSAAYDKRLVRFIFELKAMAVNGEAPNVFSCVRCGEKENLRWFMTRRGGCICETCEKKDPSPEESGRFLLEESTLYTMQYIISARVEKLYTFSVSDSVLRQLLAIMKSYRAVYLDHSFQTLKMLEGLFTG